MQIGFIVVLLSHFRPDGAFICRTDSNGHCHHSEKIKLDGCVDRENVSFSRGRPQHCSECWSASASMPCTFGLAQIGNFAADSGSNFNARMTMQAVSPRPSNCPTSGLFTSLCKRERPRTMVGVGIGIYHPHRLYGPLLVIGTHIVEPLIRRGFPNCLSDVPNPALGSLLY